VWAQTALAVVWALVGLLGLFAATVRRLQSVSEHICRLTRHRRAFSLFCASGALTFCAWHPRRVRAQLALFCSLEIFSTLLSACVNAVLLLLYHLQCQALAPAALAAEQEPWLRCDNSGVALGLSTARRRLWKHTRGSTTPAPPHAPSCWWLQGWIPLLRLQQLGGLPWAPEPAAAKLLCPL
jgi:hypothetical protein